jgi:hypothetical protein
MSINTIIVSIYNRHKLLEIKIFFLIFSRLVGIATGYGLDDQGVGVRVPVRSRIFSSLRRLDQLWDLTNLLYNGYRGFFPQD